MPLICECTTIETAEQVYCCTALTPWTRGRYAEAQDGAELALNLDPLHTPSWLLHAFARYRAGERALGVAELETLVDDPIVGRRARSALTIHRNQHNRDQVVVSVGYIVADFVGFSTLLDLPIQGPWGVRLNGGYGENREARVVRGGGALSVGLITGNWRARALLGMAGSRWSDTGRIHPSAEATAAVDVRLGAGVGLGMELGIGADPYDRDALWYGVHRAMLTFHAPSRRQLGSR